MIGPGWTIPVSKAGSAGDVKVGGVADQTIQLPGQGDGEVVAARRTPRRFSKFERPCCRRTSVWRGTWMDACAYPFGGTSAIPTREKLRSSNNLGKAVSITRTMSLHPWPFGPLLGRFHPTFPPFQAAIQEAFGAMWTQALPATGLFDDTNSSAIRNMLTHCRVRYCISFRSETREV